MIKQLHKLEGKVFHKEAGLKIICAVSIHRIKEEISSISYCVSVAGIDGNCYSVSQKTWQQWDIVGERNQKHQIFYIKTSFDKEKKYLWIPQSDFLSGLEEQEAIIKKEIGI